MPQSTNRPPDVSGKAAVINAWRCDYSHKTNGNAITSALNWTRCGRDYQGMCPACGYKDSARLTLRDGKPPLVFCHACHDSAAVVTALREMGLWGGRSSAPVPRFNTDPKPKKKADAGRSTFVNKLWASTAQIGGTLAATYLQGRGLMVSYPDSLRFLPACMHKPTMTHYPAMIAAVTNPAGVLQAIHRTYLKPDGSGKIDHPQARMMLGDALGGAVWLAPAAERMGLAEGLETALSVQQVTGLPMLACLSTAGLQNVLLPDCVREVVICADNDANGAGQRAALNAAERLHRIGKRVKLATPPQPDSDFNDLLKGASHE